MGHHVHVAIMPRFGNVKRPAACANGRQRYQWLVNFGRGLPSLETFHSTTQEHIGRARRWHAMPALSPHRRPEGMHLPVPAAPTLTRDGVCSACGAAPVSICKGEVQVCRGCLAVLGHLAAPKPAARKEKRPDAELVVPVPSARQRAIDAVVTSPEKSDRRIAAETGLDRATIARARGQLDEYQPVDMPRAEAPASSAPEPPRDEHGRFIRQTGGAASEAPVSDAPGPD